MTGCAKGQVLTTQPESIGRIKSRYVQLDGKKKYKIDVSEIKVENRNTKERVQKPQRYIRISQKVSTVKCHTIK